MCEVQEVKIRGYRDADESFIFKTWLDNYKGSPFARRIKPRVYYKAHHAVIEWILKKPTTKVFVACDPAYIDSIYGFLVVDESEGIPIIHYVFVKAVFQGHGVARLLFETAEIDMTHAVFTHWTNAADSALDRFPDLTYNPYMIG